MPYLTTTDHAQLYYEVRGSGQPVILIHGWSCAHDIYDGMVEQMKQSYRCISYSHRGHGASSVPEGGYTIAQLGRDLKDLIDYLELKNVILVGHSMGGFTIYEYIRQFGCENISKAVVIDMAPMVICKGDWKHGAFGTYSEQDLETDLELIGQDLTSFLWKFFRLVLPDMAALPETLKELVAPGLKMTNHTLPLLALWHSMFTRDYRPVMKEIKIPTLYVVPENPIYSMEAAKFIKENAAAPVEIREIHHCTHMVPMEKPKELADLILDYLK